MGGTPVGTVTVDLDGAKPVTFLSTVGDIIAEIVETYGGIAPADIDSQSITDLNTANSSVVGIYIDKSQTIVSVLDELCASIGAYWLFDRNGVFKVGSFVAPTGAIDYELSTTYVEQMARVQSTDAEAGVPVYLVKCDYKKNYTVQEADRLAGSITDARRATLALPYLTVSDTDAAIEANYLLSPEHLRTTLLTTEANADTETTRLLDLYKVRRSFYKLVIPDIDEYVAIELGEIVNLTFNRFGLDTGKKFLIILVGRNTPELNMIELEVWG